MNKTSKDVDGKEIKVGDNLIRVVDGRGTYTGHKFVAILHTFPKEHEELLMADGGFIKEPLWGEYGKEYRIVEL